MHKRLVMAFSLGILTGSALLFAIQPLFSKMVLPLLGGSPSTWNTLMVFFQAVLLLGYSYAHVSTKLLGAKKQSVLHLVLLLASLIALPLALPENTIVPTEETLPTVWLITLAASAIGIPFFMLAANAPMLQVWFAHTKHHSSEDPYFLYAISNAGSLVALLAYPFVAQPLLELNEQTHVWTSIYILFIAFIAFCVFSMWKDYTEPKPLDTEKESDKVTLTNRFSWVFFAAVPSALLLGVTNYISTDVSASPVLWVIPLSLYLLTFINVFAKKPLISEAFTNKAALIFALLIAVFTLWSQNDSISLIVHCAAFFFLCMACHFRLAKTAPSVHHLTGFYFWIALGGVLGGAFNALVAPVIFNTTYEYAISIGLATACILGIRSNTPKRTFALDVFIGLLAAVLIIHMKVTYHLEGYFVLGLSAFGLSNDEKTLFQIMLVIVFFLLTKHRPIRFGVGVGALLTGLMLFPQLFPTHEYTKRSFFGVYSVDYNEPKYTYEMWSGNRTSKQGAQSLIPGERTSTLTFYPLEGIQEDLPQKLFTQPMGVIGLGAGTIACLGASEVEFFEIDPIVKEIAQDDNFFTYLTECESTSTITLGDGRLQIQKQPEGKYGIVVLDAFSSSALPSHLLTTEAFDIYLSKLAEDGVILMNITNRHLDLKPLIAAQAQAKDLSVLAREKDNKRLSTWVALARDKAHFGNLANNKLWPTMPEQKQMSAWTDSHSNILPLLKW